MECPPKKGKKAENPEPKRYNVVDKKTKTRRGKIRMSTITENTVEENGLRERIKGFFKAHQVSQILQESNAYKAKGIPIIQILVYLTQLIFTLNSP